MKKIIRVSLLLAMCGNAYAVGWEPVPLCEHDPSESLKRSVVGIERYFDEDEIDKSKFNWTYGTKGTAWFLDSRTIVTIAHVETGAKLTGNWKEVRLFWSDEKDRAANNSFKTRARIKDIVMGIATLEPLITLELESAVPGAQAARVKEFSLRRKEPLVGIGYKDNELRFAVARLVFPEPTGDSDPNAKPPLPYLPLEIFDPNKARSGSGTVEDRYVFEHGASGSPLFDCEGNVAAVVQGFYSKVLTEFAGKVIRHTTPWGHANVTGVSALPLLTKLRR